MRWNITQLCFHNTVFLVLSAGTVQTRTQAFSPQHLSLAVLTWGKADSCATTYLDMWRSGTFPRTVVKWLSEPKKHHQDCLMLSAQSFCGQCLRSVACSLTCGFSGNVPLLHTYRYVIACDTGLSSLTTITEQEVRQFPSPTCTTLA